jgi:Cys-rich repeat protein
MTRANRMFCTVALLALAACGSSSGGGKGNTGSGSGNDGGTAECTTDSDCPSGAFCDPGSGTCSAAVADGCTKDADCAADETCDVASGFCTFSGGCLADTDCLAGETCDSTTGVCTGTPTTEPSCHQCACIDILSAGGCANLCDSAQNGNPNTPNFCNGVSALPQCAKCLTDNCGGITSPPEPTDPGACQ